MPDAISTLPIRQTRPSSLFPTCSSPSMSSASSSSGQRSQADPTSGSAGRPQAPTDSGRHNKRGGGPRRVNTMDQPGSKAPIRSQQSLGSESHASGLGIDPSTLTDLRLLRQVAPPSTGQIRSGHMEMGTLYGGGVSTAGDAPGLVVNSMNAPNNSTVQCGCGNIDCPFCNLMLSEQMKE